MPFAFFFYWMRPEIWVKYFSSKNMENTNASNDWKSLDLALLLNK